MVTLGAELFNKKSSEKTKEDEPEDGDNKDEENESEGKGENEEEGEEEQEESSAEQRLMVEAALTVDAVFMFTQALIETKKYEALPLFCNTTDSWDNGQTVINIMKLVTVVVLSKLLVICFSCY